MAEKKYNPQKEIEKLFDEHNITTTAVYREIIDANDTSPGLLNLLHAKVLEFIESGKEVRCFDVKGYTIELRRETDEGEDKIKEASQIFERLKQSEEFVNLQPLFYDKANIWWLWSFRKFCYERVDETDILNGICRAISIDTTASKTKTEILNGLRQVGRSRIPEPAKESWIQFKEIIVDVKTGERFKASPKYFITNPIPFDIGESEDTPTMDKLFGEWVVLEGLQDESFIDTLYEMIAYSSMCHQFLQRMFALQGVGSNGKGCYLKIITKFLGDENICTSELKILADKQFESSALYKKQACIMGEVDVYDMKNTNLLKKLTGEDDIRYEFKGKTPFSEKSATTCFMATNSLPVTPDQSVGYYRRWLIVDFPHIFKAGPDVVAGIPEIEYSNLAKKIIRICGELYKNNGFTNEGNVDERMKRYEERSNPLMRFIELEVEEDPEEHTIYSEFYNRFSDYLKEHRLRTMTKIAVTRALRNEGFQVKGKKTLNANQEELNTTCVFSVKLKDKITGTHQNSLLSEVKPFVENDFEKQCEAVRSSDLTDKGLKVLNVLKDKYEVIADIPEFVNPDETIEPAHKPGDIIELNEQVAKILLGENKIEKNKENG